MLSVVGDLPGLPTLVAITPLRRWERAQAVSTCSVSCPGELDKIDGKHIASGFAGSTNKPSYIEWHADQIAIPALGGLKDARIGVTKHRNRICNDDVHLSLDMTDEVGWPNHSVHEENQ